MYSDGPPQMTGQKQDDQLEHTYNSYVGIQDVALKTCQRRWTIGWSGERVRDIRACGTTWWWWCISTGEVQVQGWSTLLSLFRVPHWPRAVLPLRVLSIEMGISELKGLYLDLPPFIGLVWLGLAWVLWCHNLINI